MAEYEDWYRVLYVNTHCDKKVIQDEQIESILGISGVSKAVLDGSYGMELFVIYEGDEDKQLLMETIEKILKPKTMELENG